MIVWCHGLGGDRTSGAALAAAWAAAGYGVLLPTFNDSIRLVARRHPELGLGDDAVPGRWAGHERARTLMMTGMLGWPWRADRLAVLSAVLDRAPSILAGRPVEAEVARLGVGGHSFGAYLAQLVAGAVIDCPLGPATSFRDERVRAVVIASGQGRDQAGLADGSWDRLTLPLLNITGTRDRGATSDDPAWKWEPFSLSPPGHKNQLVIDDADHGLGGVGGASALFPPVPAQLDLVREVTTTFWDAYLADRPAALTRLDSSRPIGTGHPPATFQRR